MSSGVNGFLFAPFEHPRRKLKSMSLQPINPKSEVGRDGALRRHRAVQARNRVAHGNPICTIPSDR